MTARRLIVVTAVAAGTIVAGGCGSSKRPASATGNAGRNEFLAFSVCMRSHGVPNFPDPGPSGLQITSGSGVNPQTPAFQSANRACARLLPGGGTGRASPSNRGRLLALAECMRRHGVTRFPDPDVFAGGVPPASSIVLDGYEFKLGAGLDPRSPAFQQAMSACRSRGD